MICSGKHDTIAHVCIICQTKEPCYHSPIKCANCGLNHKANDKKCVIWQNINPKNKYNNIQNLTQKDDEIIMNDSNSILNQEEQDQLDNNNNMDVNE